MAYSVFRKAGPGSDVSFNLTPMIDVTFQLIIFFILTSQIASEALAKVELARPYEPEVITTEEGELANKIIINVLFDETKGPDAELTGDEVNVSVNGEIIKQPEILLKRMKEAYKLSANKKEFFVELRADKRVPYAEITPIMRIAAEVGIINMGLTALDEAR